MSEASDVFGSEARRKAQAVKDARETKSPIASPYRRGSFMAVRPIEERLKARGVDPHRHIAVQSLVDGDGIPCPACGRTATETLERRAKKKAARVRARGRRFHRPVSDKSRSVSARR